MLYLQTGQKQRYQNYFYAKKNLVEGNTNWTVIQNRLASSEELIEVLSALSKHETNQSSMHRTCALYPRSLVFH